MEDVESRDEVSRLLGPTLDGRLDAHIKSVNLSSLSRIPTERIEAQTIQHVGTIELVTGSAFADFYEDLYVTNFHGGERERPDLIIERLDDEYSGKREGLAPYRVVGIRDTYGRAIAAAQFSVLVLPGKKAAVPYLQYIYVRPENRRQGLSDLLHTLVLGIATAKLDEHGSLSVPFTLFETEPPVHGRDEMKRAVAAERTRIHAKSGSLAMMLRQKSNGKVLSAHVQPGLEADETPVTLIWALRANPAYKSVLQIEDVGQELIAAYYQSLRDEGFLEENIASAESIVEGRYAQGTEFCLMPLSEVTREMYDGIDGQSAGIRLNSAR